MTENHQEPIAVTVGKVIADFCGKVQSPPSASATSSVCPRHPLDLPGTIKIMLGKAASEILEAHGETFLATISHPDCTSPPEAQGRMILTALPASKAVINAACRVALGKAPVKPIKACQSQS